MQKYDSAIDRIGFERISELIDRGDPCAMVKVVREAVFK
jgi:xylose isomerase